MKMAEVQKRAKVMGLNLGKVKKATLIRRIQEQEGNFSCFQSAKDFCDQAECCWRGDCLTTH